MWEILHWKITNFPEHVFYRQSVQFGYILDFYCLKLRLGIEVDGDIHDGREGYDRNRDANLRRRGIRIYRFSNGEVLNSPRSVASQLCQIIQENTNKKCFIATAAYGTTTARELDVLRKFRDVRLESNFVGRRIADLYYLVSPSIANIIAQRKEMKAVIRECLNPIISFLKRKGY